jgi:hypothetical protein
MRAMDFENVVDMCRLIRGACQRVAKERETIEMRGSLAIRIKATRKTVATTE